MSEDLVVPADQTTPTLSTVLRTAITVPQRYLTLINNQPYFTLAAAQHVAAEAGIIVHLHEEDKIVNPDRPLIFFRYRAEAYVFAGETPMLLARAYGSAVSTETRFAYVWRPIDANTERPTAEDFAVGRARRGKNGVQIRIPNPDVFAYLHTIDLTAQYRAYRAAVNFALGMERIGMDEDLVGSLREEEQETQQPTQARTGPAIARVATGRWAQAAQAVVAATGDYYKRNGVIDYHHLLGAARKLGFTAITDENVAEVARRLILHAGGHVGGKEEQEQGHDDE